MRIRFQFTPLREGRQDSIIDYHSAGLFQFTPLREGRPFPASSFRRADSFQFTPLREGRLSCKFSNVLARNFNSRPSARGDTAVLYILKRFFDISIHAPPRGATRRKCRAGTEYSHFKSRPSARGDARCPQLYCEIFISIHAPPRGATMIHYQQHS